MIGVVAIDQNIDVGLDVGEHAANDIALALKRFGADHGACPRRNLSSDPASCYHRRRWSLAAAPPGNPAPPARSPALHCNKGREPRSGERRHDPPTRPRLPTLLPSARRRPLCIYPRSPGRQWLPGRWSRSAPPSGPGGMLVQPVQRNRVHHIGGGSALVDEKQRLRAHRSLPRVIDNIDARRCRLGRAPAPTSGVT